MEDIASMAEFIAPAKNLETFRVHVCDEHPNMCGGDVSNIFGDLVAALKDKRALRFVELFVPMCDLRDNRVAVAKMDSLSTLINMGVAVSLNKFYPDHCYDVLYEWGEERDIEGEEDNGAVDDIDVLRFVRVPAGIEPSTVCDDHSFEVFLGDL